MSYDLSYVLCLICLMYIFLYLMSYVLYVLCISSHDMSLMSHDLCLVSHVSRVLCVSSCNYVLCVLRTWC